MNDLYKEAYLNYYSLLYTMAAKILSDHEQREDAIHTVFLKLFENKHLTIDTSTLKSYLCKAVINTSINMLKHQSTIKGHHQDILKTTALHYVDETIHKSEKAAIIKTTIDSTLPEQCKLVFKKRIYEEKSLDEIATELNISKKTVKNHITKAMKLMHEQLKNMAYFKDLLLLFCIIKNMTYPIGLLHWLIVLIICTVYE